MIVGATLENAPLGWLVSYFALMNLAYRLSKGIHPHGPTLQLLLFTHSHFACLWCIFPCHVLLFVHCEPTVKFWNYFTITCLFTRCLLILYEIFRLCIVAIWCFNVSQVEENFWTGNECIIVQRNAFVVFKNKIWPFKLSDCCSWWLLLWLFFLDCEIFNWFYKLRVGAIPVSSTHWPRHGMVF